MKLNKFFKLFISVFSLGEDFKVSAQRDPKGKGVQVATGDMYGWVSHTFNLIVGVCSHQCTYCYMDRWGTLKKIRYDETREKTDLGEGNFIFVGSSTDDFASDVSSDWIKKMLDFLDKFDNSYLLQTKNPARFSEFKDHPVIQKSWLSTTIETNRDVSGFSSAPSIEERVKAMEKLADLGRPINVTCEPIVDFDHDEMLDLILRCKPAQVNIGKNTNYKVKLDEPTPEKVLALGDALKAAGVKVVYKRNIQKFLGI